MSVKERVRMCRLIDQMECHEEYSKKLGLENQSTFCGERIYDASGNLDQWKDVQERMV